VQRNCGYRSNLLWSFPSGKFVDQFAFCALIFPFCCQSRCSAVDEIAVWLLVAGSGNRAGQGESRWRISFGGKSHQPFRSVYYFLGRAAQDRLDGNGGILSASSARFLLRAVDAFPADRHRADRKTIRTAIERLKQGRIVGLFPEGGIRDGTRSLLEGAPLRAGAATLAHIAGAPILPCVIVGSDRLYSKKSWLPLRRTPIWIAFGDPISDFPGWQNPTRESALSAT
jgi:1-acyl-sn-glycerol-3-phosphate acyltransferase